MQVDFEAVENVYDISFIPFKARGTREEPLQCRKEAQKRLIEDGTGGDETNTKCQRRRRLAAGQLEAEMSIRHVGA